MQQFTTTADKKRIIIIFFIASAVIAIGLGLIRFVYAPLFLIVFFDAYISAYRGIELTYRNSNYDNLAFRYNAPSISSVVSAFLHDTGYRAKVKAELILEHYQTLCAEIDYHKRLIGEYETTKGNNYINAIYFLLIPLCLLWFVALDAGFYFIGVILVWILSKFLVYKFITKGMSYHEPDPTPAQNKSEHIDWENASSEEIDDWFHGEYNRLYTYLALRTDWLKEWKTRQKNLLVAQAIFYAIAVMFLLFMPVFQYFAEAMGEILPSLLPTSFF